MIGQTEPGGKLDDLRSARLMFLTMMGTGVRRGELLGARWRAVALADPDGPTLRVEETWVRNAVETPKSQAGHRTIALGKRIADELFDHRSLTPFSGDDDRVFPNPRTGNAFDVGTYTRLFKDAVAKAGISEKVRPFHDLRHSSITNAAAAGDAARGVDEQGRAQRLRDHAPVRGPRRRRFREEADRLEERLWGTSGTKSRYENDPASPDQETERAAIALGS